MKIRFILSHPSSELYGEVREAIIARDLVRLGHDAEVYRIYGGITSKRQRFASSVPVTYFPARDRDATPHQTVSDELLDAILGDLPDVLLFKGIGYDVVPHVLNRIPPGRLRIGFILGGNAVDPALAHADFVLVESETQIAAIHQAVGCSLRCQKLAKYIDWDTADRLYAERQLLNAPAFDIVNVGKFEPRKNHIALRNFFGRYRVAIVGDGEMQNAVAEAAAGQPDVHLLGALPNSEALGVMARSRLMVHCSLWEGVPRAIFESLACGTPVVAHDFAIQERFDTTDAVRLVPADALQPTTEHLLAQPALLDQMGKEGRRFARERHGPERLAEAAGHILTLAGLS